MNQSQDLNTANASFDLQANPSVPTRHPLGFWFFFWGELAERCSYYGMNAILLLYMTDTLKFTKPSASRYLNWFIAGTYLTPLLGGFIADRFLGKYWTIVLFSIPYVIGNALMLIPTELALFSALVILAMGSGVIKPNISTLMGLTYDQQRHGQEQLRSSAFGWFYWAINAGSVISQTSMPYLRDEVGPNKAFLLPTILMAVALFIFALGKPFYATESLDHPTKSPEERKEQWRTLGRLMGVFILITVFWGVFKQYPSTWVLFTGEKIHTRILTPPEPIPGQPMVDHAENLAGLSKWSPSYWWRWITEVMPYRIYSPDQFQFLNSFFILTLLPLAMMLFKYLEKRGHNWRPTDKMQLGFFFVTLTPLWFVMADQMAGHGKTSLIFLVLAYLSITLAEILISPVGLELAFVIAPKSMKGFITACFLLTIFVASMINAEITPLYSMTVNGQRLCTPTTYFGLHAVVGFLAMITFYFVAKPFNQLLDQTNNKST